MTEFNANVETSEEGAARVAITLPSPEKIAAFVAALLALWRAIKPIVGAAQSGGDVSAILAALAVQPTALAETSSPASTTAAPTPTPPATRPTSAGPGQRR